jgi:threonine/homoserine/homoserine lactone efflux protein
VAPGLFVVMLSAGAAYMAWIGFSLARSAITVGAVEGASSRSLWTAFRRGAVTCLLNPKAYLFVISVFPQFIRPEFGPIWRQGIVMAAMTVGAQCAIYGGLALAAGESRSLLVNHPRATMIVGRSAGWLLIAVAALAVWHVWEGRA